MSFARTKVGVSGVSHGVYGKPYTFFIALGDPRRVFILRLILKKSGICVSDIAKRCRFSVSAASQQLRILEDRGLVIGEREGRRVCYRVDTHDSSIRPILQLLK